MADKKDRPIPVELDLPPRSLLASPHLNKGTAFTRDERQQFGLDGLLPYHVSTIEEQAARRYENFRDTENEIGRFTLLSSLRDRNETLFYRLVIDHVEEMLPYIYTPTVGDASLNFSYLYTQSRGMYISYPDKNRIGDMLKNYGQEQVDIIVVTDGSRILGLGDLGIGGMAIPVGKLSLYTLFGGIPPERTLPVILDMGTDNRDLLEDSLYLGWRHGRISGREYDDFIDVFAKEVKKRYPRVILQWEDFAKPHSFNLLDRYRDKICSFNDDIQGTAAVTLAGILAALKSADRHLGEERFAILGGGSAGLGIAGYIRLALERVGLTTKEAADRVYVVDIDGLIHEKLEGADQNQMIYAKPSGEINSWKVKNPHNVSLLDVMKNARPGVLIGVSATAGAFTEDIVRSMAKGVERPVIFPLSNPTTRAEAVPEDIFRWTGGRAIVATGSPFPPVTVAGGTVTVSQCNNVYIFPGVGLGAVASRSSRIPDEFFLRAAEVLSGQSPAIHDTAAGIFPSFGKLREVCRRIAVEVVKLAVEMNIAGTFFPGGIEKAVTDYMWYPRYREYVRKIKNHY